MADSPPPLAWVLLHNLLVQAVACLALVGTVFLLVWRWDRERFRGHRIPAPARFGREQLGRELRYTLVTFVVGTSSAGGVMWLLQSGRSALVMEPVPAWAVAGWTLGLVAFNDAWFYGWHRLLHHPRLFRYVHAVHHKSVDVNPFSSYAFHGVESFLLGIWILPAAAWLPLPLAAIGVVQLIGLGNNVMAHLGYEFLPRWLVRVPVLRWTNTATFHSLHHTRLNGNYGLHSRLWDRLFGTEVPGYEEAFLQRAEGKYRRYP